MLTDRAKELIYDYEAGNLTGTGTIELFADLIKTGDVWHLQGYYGRRAAELIELGCISQEGKVNWAIVNKKFGSP